MSVQSPKGCDGGPVLQLIYTNSSFRSQGVIVMKVAGCIFWLVQLLPCMNLSNTIGKWFTLSFTEVEKLASFLICSCQTVLKSTMYMQLQQRLEGQQLVTFTSSCILKENVPNLGLNSLFPFQAHTRLTDWLSCIHPKGKVSQVLFPGQDCLSDVKSELRPMGQCVLNNLKLRWGSSSPVDAHKLKFQILRCYRLEGCQLRFLACEMVIVRELVKDKWTNLHLEFY